VLARTRYGQPTRARRAAILAVPKLLGDRKAREALEDLLDDADPHVRIDVVRALVEMNDTRSRGALRARLEIDLDARVRRRLREALRDIGEGGRRAHDALREELEKIQNEHAEMKTRIATLEAKLGVNGEKGGGTKERDGKPAKSAKKRGRR
jgi:aminopeptidase N